MALINTMRRQQAVWWKRTSETDRYGKASYESPVQIKCRWEDVAGEFKNGLGEIQLSNATVYVDRIMSIGDILKKGPIDSGTEDDPKEESGAFEIRGFEQLPDLKNKLTLYTAHL